MVLFFFYFPIKVAGGHSLSRRGKSPAPALNDNTASFFIRATFRVLFACYLNVLFLCLFAVQAHNGSALLAQNLIALQGELEVKFKF